jgi:hypothetical protein
MEVTTPVTEALQVAPDPPPPLRVQEGALVYPLPRPMTKAELRDCGAVDSTP